MGDLIQSIWNGFRLTCPACRRGPMYASSRQQINPECPECGTTLYRSLEADWLIVWLSAYTVASVVLIGLIVLFQLYSTFDLWLQITLSSMISIVVVAIGYPRYKGAAVGLLHFMRYRGRE